MWLRLTKLSAPCMARVAGLLMVAAPAQVRAAYLVVSIWMTTSNQSKHHSSS